MQEKAHLPLSQDAALVSALAGTAMPFSHTGEDQAERWLRALRLHGQVGAALQSLGVGESPLETGSDRQDDSVATEPLGDDVVDRVVSCAEHFARQRGAQSVGTADLLFALLEVYDRSMERVLYLRGTSREELVERLIAMAAPSGNP